MDIKQLKEAMKNPEIHKKNTGYGIRIFYEKE